MVLEHLVIDAGALIRGVNVEKLAKNFWTTSEVLAEIRDKKARSFLLRLPFELKVREPSEKAMAAVVSFTRQTGDFAFLSLTDLKVLALAYMLEVEENGADHLRTKPKTSQTITHSRRQGTDCASIKQKVVAQAEALETEVVKVVKDEPQPEAEDKVIADAVEKLEALEVEEKPIQREAPPSRILGGTGNSTVSIESLDDDENWINDGNYEQFLTSPFGSGAKKVDESSSISVGCITTDYTIQNSMLQMGLHLISTDGMVIRKLKQWVLQCIACFHIVRRTDKLFCPKCGNSTLERVSCSVDSKSGRLKLFKGNNNRRVRLHGTKYSIPKSKGGRFEGEILLREDQLLHGIWNQRLKQSSRKVSCAFGEHLAADIGVTAVRGPDITVGFGRMNPNAQRGRERRGKKKRKSNKK